MSRADKFIAALRQPCGRTTGHGESCVRGYLCGACSEKSQAADVIEALAQECTELRAKLGEVKP
jgi:hypothetical protein